MRIRNYVLAGLLGVATQAAVELGVPARAAESDVPRFLVDPYWPKPLPNRWVTGAVGGICVDRQDHVFGVNRSDLTPMEQQVGKHPAPVVIEYDADGDIVNAWGDPKLMPRSVHGCFVDNENNIWIGGNADGIVQKWTHDGKTLLLQIGRKGVCDNSDDKCGEPGRNGSPTLLNEPADIAVDAGNGDIYIADGYGNHRVVVFDANGKFLRQWGDAGTDKGLFALMGGGHPHCAVFDHDGQLYVCDRGNDRIEVFDKMGALQRIILRTAFGLFPFGGESGIFSGMTQDLLPLAVHPTGEQSAVALGGAAAAPQPLVVDSFAGSVRVEWDHATAFTPLGQLPFFIDFLKTAGLFDSFVADSPLNYESPNASKTRDVLGTAMLSMLAGHKRYSHIAALRGDGVLPELLGMRKIVSEDSVRRAFAAIEEKAGAAWMRRHLDHCLEPLLSERWILDIDTTVKPLYGRQEGAVVGYNPKKPGRPSHCYHTYSMAGTRLVFDVDVCAGDEHASHHAAPALWAFLDRTARDCWPTVLRGDKGFGNEKIMREAELRALAYLFKLRLTANVRRAVERLSQQSEWVDSGQGWQAKETQVRLKGWSRQRRIIVLRRRVKGEPVTSSTDEAGQQRLTFVDIVPSEELWEYQVLVTSLVEQVGSFGQLYRDRADGENIFDELKNQWGWGGFVTQDLARCRLAARMVALFYDWWNIFVRLAEPDWHREAITSRPLLLHAIAERVRHARQTTIRIASMHARSVPAAEALRAVAKFLRGLVETAEQLAPLHRWREILSRAFQAFLKGRPLRAPPRLKPG